MTSLKSLHKFRPPLKSEYTGAVSEKTNLLQNSSNKSSLYAFANANLTQNDIDNNDITDLRSRGSATQLTSNGFQDTKPQEDIIYLTKNVSRGDTLQSFSLLYGCTIGDIKRANGFIKDQDFYAVNIVKIPVKKHGLLTDTKEFMSRTTSLTGVSQLNPVSEKKFKENNDILKPLKFSAIENKENVMNLVNISHGEVPVVNNSSSVNSGDSSESLNLLNAEKSNAMDKNDVSRYLKNIDKDIHKTVRKADTKTTNVLDELHLHLPSLSSINYRPLPIPRKKSMDGADCGIKWWTILLLFLFTLVFFSILAVYEYRQTESVNNYQSTPSHP